MARFEMSYSSGATGYGWNIETDSIKEVFQNAESFKHNYTAFFSVWDNNTARCIFRKDVLEFKAETDLLNEYASRYQRYYWKKQQELRDSAIDFQYKVFFRDPDDGDVNLFAISDWMEHFRKYGKRFGLLDEFRENGIV